MAQRRRLRQIERGIGTQFFVSRGKIPGKLSRIERQLLDAGLIKLSWQRFSPFRARREWEQVTELTVKGKRVLKLV
jgi:hypothetical protein